MVSTERKQIHRVLIVEDDIDNAELLKLVLRMDKYEVRVTHDGKTAIAAAAEFRPDAVLLDVGLPDMSGFDVGREVRRHLGQDVILVALTGYGQDEDRQRAFDAGFNNHFTKPIDANNLRALLKSAR